jgi:hypothetical protein
MRDWANFEELRSYLISKSACPGALEAAEVIWARYLGWLHRKGLFHVSEIPNGRPLPIA